MLIKLKTPTDISKAQEVISKELLTPKDGKTLHLSVFWADDDKIRSLAQNRIYWQYLTTISQHTGVSKDRLHTDFKRKFLARILARDDNAFRECFDSIRQSPFDR